MWIVQFFSCQVDGNVIVVIGGDDNYRNEEEEERAVVSRWARMKVRSQLKEEFLDGRRSFIFSWDRKHREIHEQALKHYFDQNKKGKKFQYEPPGRPKLSLGNQTAPPARDTEPAHQPRLQRSATIPGGRSRQEIKDTWDQPSSLQKDYTVTRQRSVDIHTSQQPKLNAHPDPLAATTVSALDYGCSSLENRSEQSRVQRDTTLKETRLVKGENYYNRLYFKKKTWTRIMIKTIATKTSINTRTKITKMKLLKETTIITTTLAPRDNINHNRGNSTRAKKDRLWRWRCQQWHLKQCLRKTKKLRK